MLNDFVPFIPMVAFYIGMMILAVLGLAAAYSNGVTDGYGYAREPNNPGYRGAGDLLKKNMQHRWPELKDYP